MDTVYRWRELTSRGLVQIHSVVVEQTDHYYKSHIIRYSDVR